ncbi:TPA: hypothetical protein HA259_09170 [Thermoplasmata archaeon]|nr:hypothetical protein [Thermoplasmata archaeon]
MIDLEGLLARGCGSDARIGIGLDDAGLTMTRSRLREMGCRVELTGFDDPTEMAHALSTEIVDAAVRGALSSRDTLHGLRAAFGTDRVMRTAVLGTASGKAFMLTPVGIDEGMSMDDRLQLVLSTTEYLSPAGWTPTVGVLSKGRTEDAERGEEIRVSLEEGAQLTAILREEGMDAAHHTILIEEAVRDRDLLVAPDGVSGNLMFRSLHFIGSGKAYGAPVVNLPAVFVDTSRAKVDFIDPILLAAGLSEAGCGRAGRA